MQTIMREKVMVAVIVIVRTVLALGFSLGPIFEGPDEIEHFRFIYTLNTTQALPDPFEQQRGEYHQPPLYYFLAWPIAHLLMNSNSADDFAQFAQRLNPFYGSMIDILGNDNKNVYLHAGSEDFPYSQNRIALIVHLIRLLSVGLGALTVLVSFFIARLVWPQSPEKRLLMVGLIAFWPQFLYLSSLINNDNLLIFLSTLTLWIILSQIREGISWHNSAYLGIILGAILLTKVSAVFIFLPAGVGFARAFWSDRRVWRYGLVTLGFIGAVAGWWYIHNWVAYGDPTGTKAVLETWPEEVIRPGKLALDVGVERLPYAYSSVWARFGHGAVPVSNSLYTGFNVLLVITLLGASLGMTRCCWSSVRKNIPFTGTMLAQGITIGVFAVVWVLALLYWASMAWSGNQGRYLLPGLSAWGIIFAFGMHAWLPPQVTPRARYRGALASVCFLAAMGAICFLMYFRPAYAVSSPPQNIQHPVEYIFGDYAKLIGVSSSQIKAEPGETIEVTLYWRALQPATLGLLTYVHTVETDLVRRNSYPATGNLLATDWRAGEEWAEHFQIQIPDDAATQQTYRLIAGLYDQRTQQAVEAFASGNPVTPIISTLSIHAPPEPVQTQGWYCIGDLFVLRKPELHAEITQIKIDFMWQALRETPLDYTIFVHVLDESGQTITQVDDQPRHGAYPTRAWVKGEVIADQFIIPLTDTQREPKWHIAMGMYNSQDFTRLPISYCNGDLLGDTLVLP